MFLTDRHIVQKNSLNFTYSENCELKNQLLAPAHSPPFTRLEEYISQVGK